MLGWTDLKLAMAVCWKVSWNVDPLPLSVPESLALPLPDEGLLLEVAPPLDELELQAARDRAIATRAAPAVAPPCIRAHCISIYPSTVTCKRGQRFCSLPAERGHKD